MANMQRKSVEFDVNEAYFLLVLGYCLPALASWNSQLPGLVRVV
jgi:hypothetical protein